jgi:hypothetical protein
VFIANGLLDLDRSGGALTKACIVGFSNWACAGTAYHRERKVSKFIVTFLKDSSFKDSDRENGLFVKQKNSLFRIFYFFDHHMAVICSASFQVLFPQPLPARGGADRVFKPLKLLFGYKPLLALHPRETDGGGHCYT